MKEKKYLGLVVMAFALALTMAFGVKLQASAYEATGTTFYNKKNANGEPGMAVQYRITKKATGSSEEKCGKCVVSGCLSSAKSIVISGMPYDGEAYYECTGIDGSCFKNNKKLTYVQISVAASEITNISANCFSGCTNLKTVELNNTSLKTINTNAFYNCKKLSKIVIKSTKLKKSTIKTKAFKNVKNVKVTAKSSSYAKKYAKWIKARGAKAASAS